MIFVYGIAADGFEVPDGLRGVGDPPRPLRVQSHDGLAAVVADLDRPPERRDDLEAHVGAMGALAEAGTIVPMRFGTLVDDEDELRSQLLERHGEQLRRVLGALEGRVQMTLRAIYDEDVVLREVVQRHPELKRASDRLRHEPDALARDARITLGEHIAAAVEQVRVADEERIAERIDQIADEVLVEAPGHERIAARLQILVRRDRRAALDDVVRAIGSEQQQRMTLRYSGPIAPYSFSDFNLETGSPAWA